MVLASSPSGTCREQCANERPHSPETGTLGLTGPPALADPQPPVFQLEWAGPTLNPGQRRGKVRVVPGLGCGPHIASTPPPTGVCLAAVARALLEVAQVGLHLRVGALQLFAEQFAVWRPGLDMEATLRALLALVAGGGARPEIFVGEHSPHPRGWGRPNGFPPDSKIGPSKVSPP